jgi:hypothetical protein
MICGSRIEGTFKEVTEVRLITLSSSRGQIMTSVSIRKRIFLIWMILILLLSISSGVLAQFQDKKIMMVIPLKGFWDQELIKLKEIFKQNNLQTPF